MFISLKKKTTRLTRLIQLGYNPCGARTPVSETLIQSSFH